jgi:propionyl-CoA synthetase
VGPSYDELHTQSIKQPEKFWGAEAERLFWFKKWDKVLDSSNPPFTRWFKGGVTNMCYNAVDRHALGEGRNKAAIIFESPETSSSRVITFFELYKMVNRFAAVLKKRGVEKGDRVIIYMPMIPEALVSVLACARIGAVHGIVFAGFSVESLANRVIDCTPKMVICAEAGARKGKKVPLKKIVDDALALAEKRGTKVQNVIIYDRKLDAITKVEGRDLIYQEEIEAVGNAMVPCSEQKSEDPLYILYTSGTTGKPKGILRDTAGYMVALSCSMRMIYGCGPTDVYWSTSDIGWVVGHSYIIYGPLLSGIPTVVFEGTPDSPTPAIWWQTVEKYGVTVMFSAPTAMRVLRKFDEKYLKEADLTSLRYIFLAGEPLDEPTYSWATRTLGKDIIDHYWQTESGWAIITNHKGIDMLPIKPGSSTKPAMGWDCAVVTEKGEVCKPGEKGVMIVRPPLPPGALLTVWGDDQAFAEVYFSKFKPNYYSGDFAIKDADGYYWMLGRADEVINVSGHRMGTREVEEVISDHPKVAECSCIGIDDALTGQAIAAFVVLKLGVPNTPEMKTDITNLIRNRIGAIATPKILQIVMSLPKTRSGKVMRRVLRALSEKRDLGDLSTIEDGASVDEIRKGLTDMGLNL